MRLTQKARPMRWICEVTPTMRMQGAKSGVNTRGSVSQKSNRNTTAPMMACSMRVAFYS